MKKIFGSLAVLFMIALFSCPIFASFEEVGVGARAVGLGGAFTAIADDAFALYYNPAGMANLSRKEFSASYGLLQTGLNDQSKVSNSNATYIHPLNRKYGSFGFAWQQYSVQSVYKEQVLTLGYSHKILKRWSGGMNVKHLNREFFVPIGQTDDFGFIETGKVDPIYAKGSSGSNFAVDAGLLYRRNDKWTYGSMIENINEPNLSISSLGRDNAAMIIRSAIAYQDRTFLVSEQLNLTKSASGLNRQIFSTTAAEKWWMATKFTKADIGARGAFTAGSESFTQISLGCTYRLGKVQIDYGFLMPLYGQGLGATQGNHRFTFGVKFGGVVRESTEVLRKRTAENTLRQISQQLEFTRTKIERVRNEISDFKTGSLAWIPEAKSLEHREGKEASLKMFQDQYQNLMDRYWLKKSAGACLIERIEWLEYVAQDFENTGIDVKEAKDELSSTKSERAKAEVDFSGAWSYYAKIVARGADRYARVQLLNEMAERFAPTGIDIAPLEEDLATMK